MTAHHFTVDLEEYFQVSAFEPCVARSDWKYFESRVARETAKLLELLARHEVRATFFVLGWVAQRQAELVRTIARGGHEVASHGWDHVRVTHQTPHQFRESIRRTKHVLEAMTGTAVLGFRAPSFSIVPGREWALDILVEEGYRYDSSLFPSRRRPCSWVRCVSPPGAGRTSGFSPTASSARRCVNASGATSLARSTSIPGKWTRANRASVFRG